MAATFASWVLLGAISTPSALSKVSSNSTRVITPWKARSDSWLRTASSSSTSRGSLTFIEIATTDGFPRAIRVKAINGLANFKDSNVLEFIVPILENPKNYDFYFDILNLAQCLNAEEKNLTTTRRARIRFR